MSAQKPFPLLSRGNFIAEKKAFFFNNLQQHQFSGQLVLADASGKQWSFYLYLGDIQYATGGIHPVRRWQRNLTANCPQISAQQSELSGMEAESLMLCWEYQLLCLWVAHQKITYTQAAKIIRAVILEVLLEIGQIPDLTYQINPERLLSRQFELVPINSEYIITEFQELWNLWQNGDLAGYSPNKAPIIKQPKSLSEQTSAQVYQTLRNLLNGDNTLYDLAAKMKRDVVQITRSLSPFIQAGWVELINIPDLPIPVKPDVPKIRSTIPETLAGLIACIDDDIWVCKTMEKLLTSVGYQFVGVNDSLRALPTLIVRKPDLIFLDLVMPDTSGYEICSKLRKLPFFRHTPIVILTGNDGVVDQVRAKLYGASDFLSKPIDSESVFKVIHKHLKQDVMSQ